jgi:hypothetical protein
MGAGRTDGLIKNFGAGGAIPARRFVKFSGVDDDTVVLATGPTDAVIGVSVDLDAVAGDRVDVALTDIGEVTYGAAVTRGDLLVSDAQGRAVTAAPAAGANVRTAGFALTSGVLGDFGVAHLARGSMQG